MSARSIALRREMSRTNALNDTVSPTLTGVIDQLDGELAAVLMKRRELHPGTERRPFRRSRWYRSRPMRVRIAVLFRE
jgi:hypothetical protein